MATDCEAAPDATLNILIGIKNVLLPPELLPICMYWTYHNICLAWVMGGKRYTHCTNVFPTAFVVCNLLVKCLHEFIYCSIPQTCVAAEQVYFTAHLCFPMQGAKIIGCCSSVRCWHCILQSPMNICSQQIVIGTECNRVLVHFSNYHRTRNHTPMW